MTHLISKFPLGQIFATPGVIEQVSEGDRLTALARHRMGDWGEVSADDWQSNNEALESGERLLSAYLSKEGVRFWVITEYDRRETTFLLPEEY